MTPEQAKKRYQPPYGRVKFEVEISEIVMTELMKTSDRLRVAPGVLIEQALSDLLVTGQRKRITLHIW